MNKNEKTKIEKKYEAVKPEWRPIFIERKTLFGTEWEVETAPEWDERVGIVAMLNELKAIQFHNWNKEETERKYEKEKERLQKIISKERADKNAYMEVAIEGANCNNDANHYVFSLCWQELKQKKQNKKGVITVTEDEMKEMERRISKEIEERIRGEFER